MVNNFFNYIKKYNILSLSSLYILVLISTLIVRLVYLNYNSAFNDEAIYIVIGKMGLFTADWWSYGAKFWMAGLPYVYPSLTAIAYQIGGLTGSRLLNVFFSIFLIEEIYRFTRLIDLFDKKTNQLAGIIAAFISGFSAIGIYVSNLATYDMLSFLLLFFSINSFLKAANFDNGKYYFLSALSLLAAFSTKIIIGIFLPPLMLLSLKMIKKQAIKQQKLFFIYFLVPFFIGSFTYFIVNFNALLTFVTTHKQEGLATQYSQIFQMIDYIARYILLASIPSAAIFIKNQKYKALVILLTLSSIIPLFHLILKRQQTFEKHLFMTVAFLSVIIGYGASKLLFNKNILTKRVLASLFLTASVFYISSSLKLLYNLQHEWEDSTNLEKFLKKRVKQNQKILTETGGSVVLALYDITFPPKNIVTFDWIDYSNLTDDQGYNQAIKDKYFDFIELSNRYENKNNFRLMIKTQMKDNYSLVYKSDNFLVYGKNN